MASAEDKNIEVAFSHFRAERNATLPPYILLVDCETRRFTIERPSTLECFDFWCREVEHAIAAGRHIVCVPIHGKSTSEIEILGASLGYALWPSLTILCPPVSARPGKPRQLPTGGTEARLKEEEHKLRLLARMGMT